MCYAVHRSTPKNHLLISTLSPPDKNRPRQPITAPSSCPCPCVARKKSQAGQRKIMRLTAGPVKSWFQGFSSEPVVVPFPFYTAHDGNSISNIIISIPCAAGRRAPLHSSTRACPSCTVLLAAIRMRLPNPCPPCTLPHFQISTDCRQISRSGRAMIPYLRLSHAPTLCSIYGNKYIEGTMYAQPTTGTYNVCRAVSVSAPSSPTRAAFALHPATTK